MEVRSLDYERLLTIVTAINGRGIKVDEVKLQGHLDRLSQEILELKNSWKEELSKQGQNFISLNEKNKISELFFTTLKLPVLKKGKTCPSMDKKVLAVLREKNPLPGIYADSKSKQRLFQMVENVKKAVKNGRIYPILHINGATSGRFTCDGDANIQQFPHFLRDIVIPDEGELIYIDYRQIEYRVQAVLANDTKSIQQFKDGVDAHTQLALKLNLTRDKAKIVNHAISYGMTPFGLAIEAGMSEYEATRLIEDFWRNKPEIKAYKDRVVSYAKSVGYVGTIYGHRRPIAGLDDDQIWATHIQGTAADLVKKCMIDVDDYIQATHKATILTNMHDALLFEIYDRSAQAELENIFRNVDERFVLDVETLVGGF